MEGPARAAAERDARCREEEHPPSERPSSRARPSGEEGAAGEEEAARAGVAWVIREVGDPTRAGVGVEATLAATDAEAEKDKAERANLPHLKQVVMMKGAPDIDDDLVMSWDEFMARAEETKDEEVDLHIAKLEEEQTATLIYTSGTTGLPKGVVHLHSHLLPTADLYAIPYLNISSEDVVFSAAKLFFAYGLGNALTFPMAVGATSILLPGPPDPKSVVTIFTKFQPTLFFGVPTLFAMLLADKLPEQNKHSIRLSVSAGEPLPADLLHRWKAKVGTEILDGIGTTEMLHIFVSNQINDIQPGTTGRAVPGYKVRLINEIGELCSTGEIGILEVSGPTSALMYWGQREKTKATFLGEWTRTGDNYTMGDDGVMTYSGRNDDMLKVGGIYVSPFEVEGALIKHESVLEAAVIGYPDQDELIKPKAFIVLVDGSVPSEELAQELKDFVRSDLAAYKYPRWIEFSGTLPKTATGKIQRFKLRDKP